MARRKLSELAQASSQPVAQVKDVPQNGISGDPAALYNPGVEMLRGALNEVRATTSQPILRFLAKHGYKPAQSEMADIDAFNATHQKSGLEKTGETAADVGMLFAPTPFGKTGFVGKALVPAAQGALQHQAQNYARTGQVSPGEAIGETALGTAIPVVGGKIPGYLQKLGVGAARRGLGIPAKMLKGANPIDIGYALKNRLIPFFGGAEKVAENTGTMLGTATNQADEALGRLGVLYDVPKAAEAARKGISARVGAGGKQAITSAQEEAALPWVEDYINTAEKVAKKHGFYDESWAGHLPGNLGTNLRQTAQNNASYVAGKTPLGHDLASEEFARATNEQLDEAVRRAGDDAYKTYRKGDKALADAYETAREESRKLTPLNLAAKDEAIKTRRLGLGIDLALAGFGTGAAFANPLSLIPATATIGARHLLFTPGGGRMLYEAGRGLGSDLGTTAGRAALNLGRSAYFGRDR